jgi:hypothetical protein
MLERGLANEVDATPRPTFSQQLRHTSSHLDIPLYNDGKDEDDDNRDGDFAPASCDEMTNQSAGSGVETEVKVPLKKKKKGCQGASADSYQGCPRCRKRSGRTNI